MKILVTGANGNLGKEIVNQLVDAATVKAAVRNVDKSIKNSRAEYVAFDYDKPETFSEAIKDVKSVLLIAPPLDAHSFERLSPFIDYLKNNSINRVVLLTALGVDQNPETPLRKIELKLINEGFDYTIARPNFFMENFSTGYAAHDIIDKGIIVHSSGDGKTSFISTIDIAAVFVATLTQEGHSKKAYNLTGGEALSHQEVTQILTEATGKRVNNVAISNEDLKAGALEAGMPESAVDYLIMLYDFVSKGYLSFTTNTVENIIGRKPIKFQDFVNNNLNNWKSEGERQEA